MKIAKIGERALIAQIAAIVDKTADRESVGIGDDAALTKVSDGSWLVTSTDMLVQGVHFLLPDISPGDLGFKSLAVNLSDIAAMGARPRHAYFALALPLETNSEFLLDFYQGVMELAEQYNVAISGGDLVGSPGPLVISVTVQGEVPRAKALLRKGASAGDILFTTGMLGASAAGLALITKEIDDCPQEIRTTAMQAHYRPQPRIEEAIWLADSGVITAAMDLSDGLFKDIQEITEACACGAVFEEERIPVHPAAAAIAALLNRPALDFAAHGGEDYELLCAIPAALFPGLAQRFFAHFHKPLYQLGTLTQQKELQLITKEGKWVKLEFTGYQHF